jgi:uncharacterized protein YktB (UPF0637 family)
MKIEEVIDSLIEISCEDIPEEARKSIDDTIDHLVSNLTDDDLKEVLMNATNVTKDTSVIDMLSGKDDNQVAAMLDGLGVNDDYERMLLKSLLSQEIAFA